jgi:hypothetical protein
VNWMRLLGLVMVIAFAAVMRTLPHPPNFTPIAAMALFGGALLPRRDLAFVIPLAAMLISDLIIGFHSAMPAVYLAFALITVLGFALREQHNSALREPRNSALREHATVARVAGLSLSGSLLFFFITNFAVWAQTEMYAKTFAGLVTCFVAALPFLQNSLAGDLFYTGLFFGTWALAERMLPKMRYQLNG